MSLWVCDDCTTRYSVGAPACPHCGHTGYRPAHEVDDPQHDTGGGEPDATVPVDEPAPHRKRTGRTRTGGSTSP